jgi:GNAT superfamily N-acetyltransferase
MTRRIREASAGDGPLLQELLARAFREYEGRLDPPSGVHAESVSSLEEKIAQGGALVCEVEGRAIACAFYTPYDEFLYVGRFGVLPDFRRSGVGTLLLDEAERRARELGYSRVRLNVRLVLDNLRRYYEAHGYEPVEYLAHEGYPGATYVQMEKVLDPP